ncbi:MULTISPECIES: 4-hydroxy-3-methylbut-2-enyl diphosphate reductase [unclassified Sphingomonas]|uniref:4-hydroxy-3-methylbut-2-enyl diphosphate reductase n=1 Tax=unclassified Sphingomonas TaxID=196159 RepID=UPI000928AD21|nr:MULTISPECIES: 4-hydroxy-3-methylbut-2-enyl diphosphate reductase [unclassified Sphingomonas]MBN8849682.1 4-hydroxy-3-methylbut-2-enyl diphosphate reductase [Sphingomonas sp.]OJV30032.1 MAG: 4-hydroxy-3-methylbut-2-enyl diphosphate reductase [Sphingomonas sp. 67-36]
MTGSSPPLNVLLASPRGFCAGVVRAIEIVERALELYGPPVYVRHEIVHNRHVVERLRGKGAIFVEELDEIPAGAPTIFSAHGVPRGVQEAAAARDLPVLDATCPLVAKVHVQGRRYARAGRTLVLIGHAGHAEVIGTMGQIDASVHLVSTAEDVAALPFADDTPIAYVTQTTLSVDDTRGVIVALNARFSDVTGPDIADICYATQNRQTAVRDLARNSDLVIVVGARNSSNSSRLREIGDEMGVPSHLVDDGGGVERAWLDGVETVGITAGASAPDELIESVIAAIAAIRPVSVRQLDGVAENVSFALPPQLRRPVRVAAE